MTWLRRRPRVHPDLLVDRRVEAGEAVAESRRQLVAARALGMRVTSVRDRLLAERDRNHFAEGMTELNRGRRA